MMVDDETRIRRLSGECCRTRFYTRNAARPAPRPSPGKPGRGSERRPINPRPQPRPIPRKPVKPLHDPNRKAFGVRPAQPKKPLPPNPLRGMGKKGLKFLANRSPLALGFLIADFASWNGEQGAMFHDLWRYGFTRTLNCQPNGGWRYVEAIPYSGGDTRAIYQAASPNLSCTTTGQVASDNLTNGISTISSGIRWVSYGPDNHGTVVRMQLREQWYRESGGSPVSIPAATQNPEGLPRTRPAHWPDYVPYPQIDPLPNPPLVPIPVPTPLPYRSIPHRRTNPDRAPSERPDPGRRQGRDGGFRRPGDRINDDGWDWWKHIRRRRSRYKSPRIRERVIEPDPVTGNKPKPSPATKPGVHVRRPPQRNERERKYVAKFGNFIEGMIGLATESLDVLDAFFKALDPKVRAQYRWKDSNPWERLVFTAENLEHVDLVRLIQNVTSMLLEDAAIGRLGKVGAKANQSLFENFGIDLQGRMPKGYLNPSPLYG